MFHNEYKSELSKILNRDITIKKRILNPGETVRGYKILNRDLTSTIYCNKLKFEIGKEYSMPNENLKIDENGFHFCIQLVHCFNFYHFNIESENYKVFEIEAMDEVHTKDIQSCTSRIRLLREIPTEEIYELINSGLNNKGCYNTGDGNTGIKNGGSNNIGHYNNGSYNDGCHNNGKGNIGDHNFGNYNIGKSNIGSFNKGSYNIGSFNTEEDPYINLFDKPTNLRLSEWHKHPSYIALSNYLNRYNGIGFLEFFKSIGHPSGMVYNTHLLKIIVNIEAIPNYDHDKFKYITGIDLNEYKKYEIKDRPLLVFQDDIGYHEFTECKAIKMIFDEEIIEKNDFLI